MGIYNDYKLNDENIIIGPNSKWYDLNLKSDLVKPKRNMVRDLISYLHKNIAEHTNYDYMYSEEYILALTEYDFLNLVLLPLEHLNPEELENLDMDSIKDTDMQKWRYIYYVSDKNHNLPGISERNNLPINVEEFNLIKRYTEKFLKYYDLDLDYEHHIDESKWKNDAIDIFTDPISLRLFEDPVIASDGFTYSYNSLNDLFKTTLPKSPFTRERLRKIGQMLPNGAQEPGIPNTLVSQLIDKLIEGKLKTSQNKYLKYKSKYILNK